MQDYAVARRAMVDSQLRPQGVTDTAVLAAMAAVPREEFVPEGARAFAYLDRSLAVNGGAMLPPAPLGRLLTAAEPRAGDRALVIGVAPDYAAEVLRHVGADVTTHNGGPDDVPSGPFDLILIEGAVEGLSQQLADALIPGGRVATALVTNGVTRLAIGRKSGHAIGFNRFADSEVPILAAFARKPAFSF